MPAAIVVSDELWPHWQKGVHNVTGYLQSHDKVHPGGFLYVSNGDSCPVDLMVQGRSIKDMSQALVLVMDSVRNVIPLSDNTWTQTLDRQPLQLVSDLIPINDTLVQW